MSAVLVIRLSALGDVAMLVPVLYSVAKAYPDDRFILMTKHPLVPLFEYRPSNVEVFPVYSKGKHKGIVGLLRLIKQVSILDIDKVADMHDVLRSQQIRRFFRLKGKQSATIDKGRAEKKSLTSYPNKQLYPLKTSIERYCDVFYVLGFHFSLNFRSIFEYAVRDNEKVEQIAGKKNGIWVGIAPFAKHKGKIYPVEKMEKVLQALVDDPGVRVFLFGGKGEEDILEAWAKKYDRVLSVAGHYSFSTELLLMSYLDLMLTMDSGNMHLASLTGVPVVSVWGATHPYAGFYGYRQNPDNAVQILDLDCRPCSVFGDKPCFRKDYACLNRITPQMIIDKIKLRIYENRNKSAIQ